MTLPNSNRQRGFTMIEVIVATAILVLIIFAIYSSWTAILRASAVAQRAAVEVQRSRIAVRTVEEALMTAVMYFENRQYYSFITDTENEDFAYLSLVSRLPEGFPGYERYPEQNVRRITFEVVPGEDGKKELLMTQFPVFAVTNDTTQPYSVTLVRDLTWFGLDFWDPQANQYVKEFTATNQ